MKRITTTIFSLLLITCAFAQSGWTTNLLFVAKLEGEQVVPPVTTTALGEASFQLNSTRDTLCINLSVKGLSGPMTAVEIHEGHTGGTGALVADLTPFITGSRVSTFITTPALNNVFLATLMNGEYYISVMTANNPGGEIRGQLELESDLPFKASLDGNQVVPPVTTSAMGLVTFDLSRSMRSLRIRGAFENLSSQISGVVLEKSIAGNPDVIVYDLTGNVSNNILDTEIDPDTFAIEITRGNIYLNVKTVNNPNGEIRSQLVRQRPFSFDARMNGNQTVPPFPTAAIGTGMISFNGSMDTLWYDFMCSGLSGPITAIELYTGAPGVSGTLVTSLSGGLNGNRTQGYVAGASLPATFLDDCLMGNVYINVATSGAATGEVRGQLLRFAREGFTFSIDGSQETPATSSGAAGSGLASIDRDADNLHFRMIVSGLSGPVVSAHFHNAVAGQPGLVIFDLTPYFSLTGTDDGAFNYWMRTAGFDSSKVYLFLNDQVYVNLHTALYPNGEVRGQVLKEGVCNSINIGISSPEPLAVDYSIYPNPFANEWLNVSFSGLVNGNGHLKMYDISGRLVLDNAIDVIKGVNTYRIANTLQQGAYTLEVEVEGQKQMSRMVIRN